MPALTALLYLTHLFTPDIRRDVERLSSMGTPESQEMWLLLDARTPGLEEIRKEYRCHVFEERAIMAMPYPRLEGRAFVDHIHFCLLDFRLSHPEYDYCWLIESDVRFTGDWSDFFAAFRPFDHDLVTAHIRTFSQEPRWFWWDSLRHPTETIPRECWLRSLNVIFRVSGRALTFVHEAHLVGWAGFSEVLFPTLLAANGFTLLDIGGESGFTPPGYRNRFYTSYSTLGGTLLNLGTLRFRPPRRRPGSRRNTLYHPVKPPDPAARRETPLHDAACWFEELVRHLIWRLSQRHGGLPL